LGIARISTWQLEAFLPAVTKLIGEIARVEKTGVEEIDHGGESVTDVFVTLRSELMAEMVKEVMDGCMVEGRRLQVKYA